MHARELVSRLQARRIGAGAERYALGLPTYSSEAAESLRRFTVAGIRLLSCG